MPSLGRAAGQIGQQVALLAELLLQRRQQQARLRDGGFLRDDVRQRDLAALVLQLQDVERLRLDIDQPARRRDLSAQRGFLDGGQRDVGTTSVRNTPSRWNACASASASGGFDRAPRAAEHVGGEGDADLRGVKAVDVGAVTRRRSSGFAPAPAGGCCRNRR